MVRRTVPTPLGDPVFTKHDIMTVDSWRGLTRGDKVKVFEKDGTQSPGRFEFESYQINLAHGASWVLVYGGRSGHEAIQAVGLSRIRKVDRKNRSVV